MTRRNFIKLGAGATAGVAASTNLVAKQMPITDKHNETMITGDHFGIVTAETIDGKISSVKPFSKDNMPTITHKALSDRLNSRSRIEFPMVRKSYLKDGASSKSARGDEEFVRVSWETAIKLVVKEMKRIHKDHGQRSFWVNHSWTSPGTINFADSVCARFMTLAGGYTATKGDYSTGAAQVILPYVFGNMEVYDQQTDWDHILRHTKQIVFWGCDPVQLLQMGWNPNTHATYPKLEKLKKLIAQKKITSYSVDPVANDTHKYLHNKLLRIKPTTDVAMMLAIAHYLFTTKKYNEGFVNKYTVGFDKFTPYLMGKTEDMVVKDFAWASEKTGVSVKEMKKFADDLVSRKTFIMSGWVIQRAEHGEQAYWMLMVLSAMLGYIGGKGTGISYGHHYTDAGANTGIAPGLPKISGTISSSKKGPWNNAKNFSVPVTRMVDCILNPGKKVAYQGSTIEYPEIKFVIDAGANVQSHHQDLFRSREAFKKLDTYVVVDHSWTASAKLADIVLPAAMPGEKEDITLAEWNTHLIAMKKIQEPIGETKSDFEIFRLLSKEYGYEDVFTEGKSEKQWIKEAYDNFRENAKGMKIKMPDFNTFWKKGYFTFKMNKKEFVRHTDFIKNPMISPLGTASGKIEIHSLTVERMKMKDCKGHPMWFEKKEGYNGKDNKDYPFQIISPHPKYRLHSQLNETWIRGIYEVQHREPVWINPEDAVAKGIKNGDVVKISSRRASLLAGAVVTDRVTKGVLRLEEGAWFDPDPEKKLCKHGAVNSITQDTPSSEISLSVSVNAVVNIEKYKEATPRVTAFDKPKLVKS